MNGRPITLTIADSIKIPLQGLNPVLERKILDRLTFPNPDYENRMQRGEWIGSIPPKISCVKKTGRFYQVPRGFLDQLKELLEKFEQPFKIDDRRRRFPPVTFEFHGQLKDYQLEAAENLLEKDSATLIGGHKSGKTVIALYSMVQRAQPVLVLVPRVDQMEGWIKKIENFLQIDPSQVGIIGPGERRDGEMITVAHTGEALRNLRTIRDRAGYVVLDDCNRCAPKVFTHLMPVFDSMYILGLASTTQRKDRLSRLIYLHVGDIVHAINEKDAKAGRGILQAHVVARPTAFEYPYSSRADYGGMLESLMSDQQRSRMIADDIEAEISSTSKPMVILYGDETQKGIISGELRQRGIEVMDYEPPPEDKKPNGTAGCPRITRDSNPVAVFMTPQALIRCVRKVSADVVFLAFPTYFQKGLAQAIKDLFSNGNGGRLKIYDYVDQRVGLLENYFRMRSYNYGVHPDVLLESN